MSAVPDAETAPETCPNCGSRRVERYCSSCGQKAGPVAPTMGYFMRDVLGELLNVDGKIFRSLRLLLTRPGFLTAEIFAGRRASYVAPFRLYLAASVVMFAANALFGAFGDVNFEYTPNPGEEFDPALAARAAATESAMVSAINVWLPRAMFVLVPLFAALVMLVRRHSGHTYPQHLYFALHVHAAWFFANAVDSLFEGLGQVPYVAWVFDKAMELYMVAYLPLAFWRAYGTGILGALWRALLVGFLYFWAMLSTLVAIVAPTALPVFFG
jgi:hypothetical protein